MRCLSVCLLFVAAAMVILPQPPGALEQTVFLERVAKRVEHAPVIVPEAERAMRHAIKSMRRNGPPADEALAARQKLAIQRVEDILWNRGGAPADQATATPSLAGAPGRPAVSEDPQIGALKPLRPLYPFQPNELHGETASIEPHS
jgi:hypothetical protein